MSFLNTSVSGLLTAQRALATISHNIANVNTPGYSRQRVEFEARDPQFTGAGYIGKGVGVGSIKRIQSDFINEQLRISTSSSSFNSAFFNLASRIDNILTEEQAGLSPNIVSFFNAVQDVADIPSSLNNRQVMLSEAESLVDRFQFLESRLTDLSGGIRTQLVDETSEINTLSQSIADINVRIVSAMGNRDTQPPNDLLDQRDEMIRQLSEFVAVTTVEQTDGAVNVFTGSGQSLVAGAVASTLQVTEPYQGHYEISITNSFGTSVITQNISGGSLGGLLDFQSQMLEPTINSLGRLAIGIADTFNDQHILGRNQDGQVNQTFFTVPTPVVTPLGSAPNNVTSTITDPTTLSNSDYNLTYNGGNSYTLIRLSDNTTTAINTGGTTPFTTSAVDGFTLTITAGATAGDQFIIRPTVVGARDITTTISDPRKIAAAGPLRSEEVTDVNGLPTNTGNSKISAANISSITGIPLASSITLTFDLANNRFNVSSPPGGTLAYNPATQSGGVQFTIAAAGNATFTISGVPDDGDQFIIENNLNSDGDNRNALSLAALQESKFLLNGAANYLDTYGQLVVEVGTATRQAEVSDTALSALLQQATEARESVSGVNLDEEAANLLELQQIYQAAAQMISTADLLFQTLIDSV